MNNLDKKFIGTSVSEGTLKTDDLVENMLSFLREHDNEGYAKLLKAWRVDLPHPNDKDPFQGKDFKQWCRDDLDYDNVEVHQLLAEIDNHLNDIAPVGCYFGAHLGNGSDFGFWMVEEDEEEGVVDDEHCSECGVVICSCYKRIWGKISNGCVNCQDVKI
jgi:hypothetical protein